MALELSPINVVGYQILRSNYEVLDLEHPGPGMDELNFHYNTGEIIRQDNGADKLEAELEVHVAPSSENPSGYRLDVSVRGIFIATYVEDGGTIADFEMFMKVNAFSLLYAFVRSHVQMLTSISPSGQICLPCLDVGSIAGMLSSPS